MSQRLKDIMCPNGCAVGGRRVVSGQPCSELLYPKPGPGPCPWESRTRACTGRAWTGYHPGRGMHVSSGSCPCGLSSPSSIIILKNQSISTTTTRNRTSGGGKKSSPGISCWLAHSSLIPPSQVNCHSISAKINYYF